VRLASRLNILADIAFSSVSRGCEGKITKRQGKAADLTI
jgi:hypothetical protein